MHQFAISRSTISENPHLPPLLEALNNLKKGSNQRARVYQTQVPGDGKSYIFMTTSKDLHLLLGVVNFVAQYHLAKLLEQEFEWDQCNQLMLYVDNWAILVTMTSKDSATTFTVTPAHQPKNE